MYKLQNTCHGGYTFLLQRKGLRTREGRPTFVVATGKDNSSNTESIKNFYATWTNMSLVILIWKSSRSYNLVFSFTSRGSSLKKGPPCEWSNKYLTHNTSSLHHPLPNTSLPKNYNILCMLFWNVVPYCWPWKRICILRTTNYPRV